MADVARWAPEQKEAVRTLVRLWPGERIVLLGAAAIGCFLPMRWRRTLDLDLSITVPLREISSAMARLEGWRRNPKVEHRWSAPGNVTVDIIPASAELLQAGEVVWPESGFRMSLLGIRLAFAGSVPVHVDSDLVIRAAPLPVIVLLKMLAYMDRPSTRENDLADIAYIFEDYIGVADPRRFADDILDLDLAFDEVSPYLLGRDLDTLLNEEERAVARRFMEKATLADDFSSIVSRMLSRGPRIWNEEPEEVLVRLAAFARGLQLTH